MRAIWYEGQHYIERANVPRGEEYEPLDGESYIQFEDISLDRARHMAGGVSMDGVERVIKSKNNIVFSIDDRIEFEDEFNNDGSRLNLKVKSVQLVIPADKKQIVDRMPKLKYQLAEKVLYLQ